MGWVLACVYLSVYEYTMGHLAAFLNLIHRAKTKYSFSSNHIHFLFEQHVQMYVSATRYSSFHFSHIFIYYIQNITGTHL